MNLFDLVKRPDRSVLWSGEQGQALTLTTARGTQRGVVLPPASTLTLANAQELTALWVLADDLGWAVLRRQGEPVLPRLTLQLHRPVVCEVSVRVSAGPGDLDLIGLRLDWPHELVAADTYSLSLHNPGTEPMTLVCGPLIKMPRHLLPYARGVGVEVGPGLRPMVLPSKLVDVSYVEEQDPHAWLSLYNKSGDKPGLPAPHILSRYVRGSATTLTGVRPGSLDFVFSNHVFEHLPNPLQVLRNWHHCLRPGGMILGVVPDPRYTFDCRQPATTLHEATEAESAGGHEVTAASYERWCRHTEPRHTPHDLMRRGYSIHVSFFTPESFRWTVQALQERGWFDRVFVYTATNHKDFAFALRRAP